MKRYQYIIIDDDDMDRLITSFHMRKNNSFEHKASFSDSLLGLDFLKNNEVDIVFLDIDMPGINGLELSKQIDKNNCCVVFITSHAEFALEGFNNEAFDYIVKPLKKERIEKCISRLKEFLDIKFKAGLFEKVCDNNSILVKTGNKSLMLKINEIAYLEALKDYTKIVNYDDKSNVVYGNLGTMLRQEAFSDFIRIHRSYAIHKKFISQIKATEIILINQTTLPLSKFYVDDLLEAVRHNG